MHLRDRETAVGADTEGKSIPGRGNSRGKDPEGEEYLTGSRNSKSIRLAGSQVKESRMVEC